MNPNFSIGQIQNITIPPSWEEHFEERERAVPFTMRYFHPQDDENAMLAFFYRGRRLDKVNGEKFRKVLESPAHVLNQHEFEDLRAVLRDKNDPEEFQVVIAKTEDFNGKRVLIIEGRYLGIAEDNRHMFIDSDGTGTAVQEVFYQAHRSIFPRFYKAAAGAMRTIQWKERAPV
ncbi:MAG: hypothetical protein K2X77_02990 [Candidatus Obscuribacterales bacterium]|nr:hypothetical protein [Candidatus Obscuribacterales bacterium]